jgi:hypothetical protein
MRLCQLFLASRISRHIFLATTTKTNTSGNTLFYTDIMSNKHFLGGFSATYIINHDNSRFLGMYLFIFKKRITCNVSYTLYKRYYFTLYFSREANVSFRNSSHKAKTFTQGQIIITHQVSPIIVIGIDVCVPWRLQNKPYMTDKHK